jgi:hypothetical protein
LVHLPDAVGVAFGHPCLAAIHQVERCLDGFPNLAARGRAHAVARLEGLFDGAFEGCEVGLVHPGLHYNV